MYSYVTIQSNTTIINLFSYIDKANLQCKTIIWLIIALPIFIHSKNL